MMKVAPTRLECLQEGTKSDPTLGELYKLITAGWPDSMQNLPERLH